MATSTAETQDFTKKHLSEGLKIFGDILNVIHL